MAESYGVRLSEKESKWVWELQWDYGMGYMARNRATGKEIQLHIGKDDVEKAAAKVQSMNFAIEPNN